LRILILNQYFYPDHSATSQLMTDLAEELVEQGLEVTALAGRGRYNGGASLAPRETYRGVRIERAWATSFGKGSIFGRLCDYLSFYFGAAWKLAVLPRHDLVMVLTTPPLINLVALIIGRFRGMRVVALVQDVYPDVAVSLGALKERSLLTRLLSRLNYLTLSGADRIIVLGECMRDRIQHLLGEEFSARMDIIHNWADGNELKPLDGELNHFIEEHSLKDKFVVLFSGNMGHVNEFATVLNAAHLLRDRKDILFLFIGEGARAPEIREFSTANRLQNIRMLPYQSRRMLRHSLAAGDVHLVTLVKGLAGLSVPSKTYGIMASGRPILFVGDTSSTAARLVKKYRCGEVLESGESERLAEVIAHWATNREELSAIGSAARRAFEERFDRPQAVDAYMQTFKKCMIAAPKSLMSTLMTKPSLR
jgi:glycosyltransferase involved in cell wall biosynthesis